MPRPRIERLLEVGQIVRPHGLSGEVIVALISNRPERLDPGSVLVGQDQDGRKSDLTVISARPHQQRFIVIFDGTASRESAEALRGTVLFAEPIDDPEALFVHELIGCEVVEVSGERHGLVVAVEHNPASDLLIGEAGWLVPLRFVVGREDDRIVVDAPEGLFE
ncbi:MAG: ribosome maturation factor RimM [Acidimicrobiales bacterium]